MPFSCLFILYLFIYLLHVKKHALHILDGNEVRNKLIEMREKTETQMQTGN